MSDYISGINDDIVAIRQHNDLTIIQTETVNITIKKSIDEITVKDVEDVLAGTSDLEVTITVIKQADTITITRPAVVHLDIID